MRKHMILLIVGLVLFGLGCYQNFQYEEHSLKVKATITDIDTREDADGDHRHTYYGEYEVHGKVYRNKKLLTEYGGMDYEPDREIGDTVKITVNPEKPEKKVAEGGFVGTVGFVIAVYAIVMLVKARG